LKFSILFTITPFLLPNNWVWFHDFAVCCYPPVALPTLPRFPSSVNKLSKLTLQLSQLSPPHQLKAFPSCSNPFLVYTLCVGTLRQSPPSRLSEKTTPHKTSSHPERLSCKSFGSICKNLAPPPRPDTLICLIPVFQNSSEKRVLGDYRWVTCGGCLSDTQDSGQSLILSLLKQTTNVLLLISLPEILNIQVFFNLHSPSSQKRKRRKTSWISVAITPTHTPPSGFLLSPQRVKKGIPPFPMPTSRKKKINEERNLPQLTGFHL
jgi:hypothetical protein